LRTNTPESLPHEQRIAALLNEHGEKPIFFDYVDFVKSTSQYDYAKLDECLKMLKEFSKRCNIVIITALGPKTI